MKTKRGISILFVIVMFFLLTACGGYKNASVKGPDGKILVNIESASYGITPPIGPDAMGRLMLSKAFAEYISNMSKGLTYDGNTANYQIGITNNDSKQTAYFYHPEVPGLKIPLPPNGGFFILPVATMPGEINVRNAKDDIIKTWHPFYDLQTLNLRRGGSGYKKKLASKWVDIRYYIKEIY